MRGRLEPRGRTTGRLFATKGAVGHRIRAGDPSQGLGRRRSGAPGVTQIGLRHNGRATLQHAFGLDIFDGLRGGSDISQSGSGSGRGQGRRGRLRVEKGMGSGGSGGLRRCWERLV